MVYTMLVEAGSRQVPLCLMCGEDAWCSMTASQPHCRKPFPHDTTTGGAARALPGSRMDQCEWPDKKVYFTSVTEQWR